MVISQIEAILDQIHVAILSANFAAITALTPQLERMQNEAAHLRDLPVLQHIKAKAERNAACLLAAGRGVRAAKNRITELRAMRAGTQTYNARGQRTDLNANTRLMGRL